MKAFDYLLLAEWLLTNRKSPDGFRTSVSRGYYAALHTALELLGASGVTVPKAQNKHEAVPDLLSYSGDNDIADVGQKLDNLRGHRNRADYDFSDRTAETEAFAQLRLNEAKDIVARLSSCALDKQRFAAVIAAVKKRADFLFLGT
jgi:uncharacterized protein (UPF0332 family)